jgi:hypothetical protein
MSSSLLWCDRTGLLQVRRAWSQAIRRRRRSNSRVVLTNLESPLLTNSLLHKFCDALTGGQPSAATISRPPPPPLLSSAFAYFILLFLSDLITLFTLVLPRDRLEPRCRFRTIRRDKVQKPVFSSFYARSALLQKYEVQGRKADVPTVRKLIDQGSREPKVYVSLFRAIFRPRVVLPGDSFTTFSAFLGAPS